VRLALTPFLIIHFIGKKKVEINEILKTRKLPLSPQNSGTLLIKNWSSKLMSFQKFGFIKTDATGTPFILVAHIGP
jgi:hypothetical protein